MGLSESEKRERIAVLFQRIQLAESQRQKRVVTLDFLHKQYVPDVSYTSFVAIANGKRLPAWDNAVALGRVWPEIWKILELPEIVPDNPMVASILRGARELSEEDLKKVLRLVEQLEASKKGNEAVAA